MWRDTRGSLGTVGSKWPLRVRFSQIYALGIVFEMFVRYFEERANREGVEFVGNPDSYLILTS